MTGASGPVDFRPTRSEALYLAGLALVVLLVQLVTMPADPAGPDAVTYLAIAREQIADSGFWADPESLVRNFWAVGYPTALAVVLRLGNDQTGLILAIQALLMASLVVVPWLLARGLPRAAQWAAPALLAAAPALWWMGTTIGYEALLAWFMAFSFAAAWVLYRKGAARRWASAVLAVICGLLLAGAMLTQSKVLVLVPVIGYLLWRAGRTPFVVGTAALVVGLLPWMVRNALVLGSPNPLSGNAGYNLWVGNNPEATNGGSMLVAPPTPNGESMLSAAVDFILSQPERVIELTWIKAARLLQPTFIYLEQVPVGPARTALHLYAAGLAVVVVVGFVAFVGAWLLGGRRAVPRVVPIALAVMLWFATHLPFIAEPRFMTTVLPLAIPVAVAAWLLIGTRLFTTRAGHAAQVHAQVQELERQGMAVPLDLAVPSWRAEEIVVDSRVIEPTSEITVPAQECGFAEERHAWPALIARTLRGVVLDADSCLVFAGERVIAQSGTGTRAARDASFVSGATMRIREGTPVSIPGPIAPLGDVHHHYHVMIETLPRLLHARAYRPDVTFVTTQVIPERYRTLLDSWAVPIVRVEPGTLVVTDELILVDQPELFWPRRTDLEVLQRAFDVQSLTNDAPGKIYLSRRRAGRSIENEYELEQRLSQLGFRSVLLEDLSIREQVNLFSQASVVIAPHGAGLVGVAFVKINTGIVEITSGEAFENCYRRIAAVRGLRYSTHITPGGSDMQFGSAAAVWPILSPWTDSSPTPPVE